MFDTVDLRHMDIQTVAYAVCAVKYVVYVASRVTFSCAFGVAAGSTAFVTC